MSIVTHPCSLVSRSLFTHSLTRVDIMQTKRQWNEAKISAQRVTEHLSRVARSHWRNDAINSAQSTKVFFLSSAMVVFSWGGGCSGKEEGRACISQKCASLSKSLMDEFHHKRQTWPSMQPALSRKVTTSCNAVGSAAANKTEITKNTHGTSSRPAFREI